MLNHDLIGFKNSPLLVQHSLNLFNFSTLQLQLFQVIASCEIIFVSVLCIKKETIMAVVSNQFLGPGPTFKNDALVVLIFIFQDHYYNPQHPHLYVDRLNDHHNILSKIAFLLSCYLCSFLTQGLQEWVHDETHRVFLTFWDMYLLCSCGLQKGWVRPCKMAPRLANSFTSFSSFSSSSTAANWFDQRGKRKGGWGVGSGCRKILWMKPSLVTSMGTAWRMNHVGREGGGISEPQTLFVVLKTDEPSGGIPGEQRRRRLQHSNKQQQQWRHLTLDNNNNSHTTTTQCRQWGLCMSARLLAALSVTWLGGEAGIPPLLQLNCK